MKIEDARKIVYNNDMAERCVSLLATLPKDEDLSLFVLKWLEGWSIPLTPERVGQVSALCSSIMGVARDCLSDQYLTLKTEVELLDKEAAESMGAVSKNEP